MNRSGWPSTLTAIAEIVGDGAALKLVGAFGGVKVYVPISPTLHSPLTRAIGLDAARALATKHAREELEIPNAAALRSKKRAILRAAGNNVQVARSVGATRRYVRIVRKSQSVSAELPLFRHIKR